MIGDSEWDIEAALSAGCRVGLVRSSKNVGSAAEAAARLMDEFDLAVVPLDTPHHSYLRFTSLYQPEDQERLAELRDRLQIS